MKGLVTAFAVIALLTGCVMRQVSAFKEDGLRKIDLTQLCYDYYTLRRDRRMTPDATAQLEKILLEKGLPATDLKLAQQNRIGVGMTQNGLYAAWGRANVEKRLVDRQGVRIRHSYGYSDHLNRPTYVYTEDGIITAWQDQRTKYDNR
ncbi:MAG: hypothetical protein AB1705_10070 [Verrucomicrobiota bacterium]